MTSNADQVAYWNEVAGPKWVTNQARLDRFMAPLTALLVDAIATRPGESALDVGCGCGDLALTLAARVGAAGRVLGVDVSEPMLAQARARTVEANPPARLDWLAADAMVHPFAPHFDVLASRFGVMFFDDRPRAFANLRRALKPHGRFAFLTWRGRAEVEWMQAPLNWLTPVLPMPEDMDGAIGPFALADGQATCELLTAAGFSAVQRRAIDCRLRIGSSLDEAWAMLAETGPAAAAIRDMDAYLRPEAEALVRAKLSEHFDGDRVDLGGACWLYSGRA